MRPTSMLLLIVVVVGLIACWTYPIAAQEVGQIDMIVAKFNPSYQRLLRSTGVSGDAIDDDGEDEEREFHDQEGHGGRKFAKDNAAFIELAENSPGFTKLENDPDIANFVLEAMKLPVQGTKVSKKMRQLIGRGADGKLTKATKVLIGLGISAAAATLIVYAMKANTSAQM
ncbi:hypothetical protein ON010_g11414 [Phytophthora cinnamomi]|nr:hypothetical protein ON010_g11414 [Phytophthora cinnamomi]